MIINICREGEIRFPYKGIKKKDIQRDVKKILHLLHLTTCSVAIVFTDNKTIQKINKRFRRKNKPTDVISFAEQDAPFPQHGRIRYLGDVFISLEQAWQQYPTYSPSFYDEVRRLLVHGILHLLGYDHEISADEEKRMRKKEDELLKKMVDE
ncbi:MAG: rRNA maturation RNase YbeY [Spirochaetes bacterium]|nr:rRNA maturation RNase YbeY [Spirochaetota bacterium]